VVAQMLALANPTRNDVLYDLGSGDGRIVIEAARRFGTRGWEWT
jgi:precorrin-6B methylase 2